MNGHLLVALAHAVASACGALSQDERLSDASRYRLLGIASALAAEIEACEADNDPPRAYYHERPR